MAGGVGRCEGFAVGGGVAPGGAQFGVGVEGGAEVRGFGGGGARGAANAARSFATAEIPRLRVIRAARLRRSGSRHSADALARNDIVVMSLAASKSNSSCCELRGGFFRGEVMPRISSSVARGGGAAGAAVRDGDDEVGASVADGMWCSSSTGIPACACVKTRLVRARRARSKNAFFGFACVLRTPRT